MWMRGVLGMVGSAVLAMTLAGCGDTAGPTPGEAVTPTPSPAPTTTEPTPDPDDPQAEDDPDAEAGEDAPDADEKAEAIAFVYDYLDAYNEAMEDGDTAVVGGLAADECDACSASIQRVHELHEAGESVEGGQFADPEVQFKQAAGERIELTVITDISAAQVLDEDGEQVEEHPAHLRLGLTVAVEPDDFLGWQIVHWEDDPTLPTPTPEP